MAILPSITYTPNQHFTGDYGGTQSAGIGFPSEISSDFMNNWFFGDGEYSPFDINMYKIFTDEDTSIDTGIVTYGVFQDGASNIATFFSSSTQY